MSSQEKKWFLFLTLLFGRALFVVAVDFDFIKELHNPQGYNGTDTEAPTIANGGYMSRDANGGDMSVDANGGDMSRDANGGDISVDAKGGDMSRDANGGVMSRDANGGVMSREAVQKRSSLVAEDNEVEGRSTQSIVDEVQTKIEDFIKRGFERANRILLEQKNAATTRTEANFIQFHAPAVADVGIQHASDCRGLGMLETSKLIAEHFKIPKKEADETLQLIRIPEGICKSIENECFTSGRHLTRQTDFSVRPCNPQARYSNVDGTCNNLINPKLGASGTIFKRLLPAAYADGVNSMRVSSSGGPLPNPRVVSNALFNTNPNPLVNPDWTQMIKGWGQFLDHDITRTPEAVVLDNLGKPQSIVCCDNGHFPTSRVSPDCKPINVTNDQFYRSNGIFCHRFVRSVASDCGTCHLRARTQVNANTHYIDGSQVYGSNFDDQQNLRSFRGGKLKVSTNLAEPGRCPASTIRCDLSYLHQMKSPDTNTLEFVAGDVRVAEQPGLTCLHTIFVRYHNMLARSLSSLNPQWNEETLYQEARRIVVALMQHITYSEFIPVVLGRLNMEKFKLVPINRGFLTYNASVDPSITVAFSTAAFRFGHTLIGDNLLAGNRLIPLRTSFNNEQVIQRPGQGPSQIIRGEFELNSSEMDVHLVSAVRNSLFASGPNGVGLDLMSLNIMRGRDHGLPGYNAWRRFCGLPTFSTFAQLINSGVMIPEAAQAFARVYASVDDIDIFPGGLAEKEPTNEVTGGFLGELFTCIFGRQFHDLRFGDRFWFENGNKPSSFTGRQLFSLKRMTLSSIFCDTTVITSVQPFTMLKNTVLGNAARPCSSLAHISLFNPSNLAAWKV